MLESLIESWKQAAQANPLLAVPVFHPGGEEDHLHHVHMLQTPLQQGGKADQWTWVLQI